MNSKILSLVELLSLDPKKLKYFCELKNIEDMYKFSKTLEKDLTEEEFFDFAIEIANCSYNPEKIKELYQNELNIAGGKSKYIKLMSPLLSLIMFGGNFYAKNLQTSDSSTTTFNKIIKKVENSKSLKTTLKTMGKAILASGALIASAEAYKYSDNFFQKHVIGYGSINMLRNFNVPCGNYKPRQLEINNHLKGYAYESNIKNGILNGYYVIFYSGSASPNESQIENVVNYYTNKGATVIGVDYEGFGASKEISSSGKIRQKNIYSNAQEIYDYVKKDYTHGDESHITIHGFSLGGPVAAHVAANASAKLCGLVLQSSMKNTASAAYNCLKRENFAIRILGTIGGYLFADQFNCEKELKRLCKKNPNIPIAICGGSNDDHLSLEYTHLDEYAERQGFANLKTFNGTASHMSGGGAPTENFETPNLQIVDSSDKH